VDDNKLVSMCSRHVMPPSSGRINLLQVDADVSGWRKYVGHMARAESSVPYQRLSEVGREEMSYTKRRNLLITLDQWFTKWAVPPPGGRWDYRGGR
jgi:hypothetical protein